jgi:hypothetical protein
MHTVVDPFKVQKVGTDVAVEATMPLRITTTLFDLMAAMHAVVGPDEDVLIVATMVYLLRSGRITFLGEARESLFQYWSEGASPRPIAVVEDAS